MAVTIHHVEAHSLCAKKGIVSGDILYAINGNTITDVLDYQFYVTESVLRLVCYRKDKGYMCYRIEKEQYEDIGLGFESYLMDQQHTCTNQCIFCFVDQMPPGMRPSLYVKDDDARMSFLYGNYITMTNLKPKDIERIIRMRISPINVSVHTTDPELRCEMMHNRFAGKTLAYLKQLADASITLHCQLVLCPGINDGAQLERTLHDLSQLYPSVQSIACVPVGLTRFREGLYPLESYHKETARGVIQQVEAFAEAFYQKHQVHLAYASDEFYIQAELPLPDEDYYEDFAQLENGVGTIALLRSEFAQRYVQRTADAHHYHCSIATGVAAAPFLRELVDEAKKKWHNLNCTVYAIENNFFGSSITVAGLLTGKDLAAQLQGKALGKVLYLPQCVLRHEQDRFLDDMTVEQLSEFLQVPIRLIETNGDALLDALLDDGAKEI